MAPDTPVRASSPHRVRGAARGPSPSPSLTVRHGIGFAMNPCASLLRLYAEAGPVAAIGTRRKPFVHLFGPDANAFVFANSALFQWREAFDLLVPVNGETALIVSDGADHRRRRRLVQPAFHHRRVAGYVARMAANTDAALDSWRPGQTLDAYAELRAVIRRNTVEVLFGDRLAADAEVIGRRLQVALAAIDQNFVLQMMLRSVPNPYMRRVAASRDLVVRRVGEEVERREAEGGEHDDVLGMLLAARDEDGTGLTRQELQDQVISLISAGYDTTSAAMAWAVYALLAHPEAAERARREVAEVVGDRPVEAADLPALTYLDGVVNETLRLFPPAVLSARVPVEDFEYAATGSRRARWCSTPRSSPTGCRRCGRRRDGSARSGGTRPRTCTAPPPRRRSCPSAAARTAASAPRWRRRSSRPCWRACCAAPGCAWSRPPSPPRA
nr:cytochrome P450 [Actinomadura madurae]